MEKYEKINKVAINQNNIKAMMYHGDFGIEAGEDTINFLQMMRQEIYQLKQTYGFDL